MNFSGNCSNLQFFDDALDAFADGSEELRDFLELLLLLRDELDDEEDELEYLLRLVFGLSFESLLLRSRERLELEDFDFSRYLRDNSRSLSESEEYRVFLRGFSRLLLELFGISMRFLIFPVFVVIF